MFAVISLGSPDTVMSFAAGPERFGELIERNGVSPAPYLARAHWVALEEWTTIPAAELKELLVHARELICAKLPKRTKDLLALSAAQKKKLIAERRKLLATQGKTR